MDVSFVARRILSSRSPACQGKWRTGLFCDSVLSVRSSTCNGKEMENSVAHQILHVESASA